MKATTWLCPVLTLLCATRLVYTAQRGYPLDYADSSMLQNDYVLDKRNKPSLSIVNPLDVLRQRLLLEIARRQMKENTRQVELNRAILKNVGKRISPASVLGGRFGPLLHQLQQQQVLQQRAQLNLEPAMSLFDLLQRPAQYTLENDKQSPDIDIGTKHRPSGNDVGNETNRKVAGMLAESDDANNNAGNAIHDAEDDDDRYNDGYQLHYLYRKAQNNLTTE